MSSCYVALYYSLSVLLALLKLITYFTHFFRVFVTDFKQVHVWWGFCTLFWCYEFNLPPFYPKNGIMSEFGIKKRKTLMGSKHFHGLFCILIGC